MNDYRIEAASKEEWAERALAAEAKLDIAVEALGRIAEPCSVSFRADWRVMYEGWRAICVERVDTAREAYAALTKIKGKTK